MDSPLSPEGQSTSSVRYEQDVTHDCSELAKSESRLASSISENSLPARLQAPINESDNEPSQVMISESDSHDGHQSDSKTSSPSTVPKALDCSKPETNFLRYSKPRVPPNIKGVIIDDDFSSRNCVPPLYQDLASRVPDDLWKYMLSEVPRDNRIQLIHDMAGLWVDENDMGYLSASCLIYEVCIWSIKWAQNTMLRSDIKRPGRSRNKWCDMWIMDHVKSGTSQSAEQIVYQIGDEPSSRAERENLGERSPYHDIEQLEYRKHCAPWRRIIFYKGLSTSLERDFLEHRGPYRDPGLAPLGISPDPVGMRESKASIATWTAINEAVSLHLDCSSRKGGEWINPYLDASKSFHITFYEIVLDDLQWMKSLNIDLWRVDTKERWKKETWKKGQLYIDPGSPRGTETPGFRRSAFTILVVTENLTSQIEKARCPDLSPKWGTMLVLCPSLTSTWGNLSEDEHISRRLSTSKWKTILEYSKVRVGEVAIIKEEYGILPQRWSRLLGHINSLLQEDFMDPESYIKLIFDDDQLSTSKKYFWILACIQEFRTHILDNIKQWNLYRQARLDPFSDSWPNELTELVKHIERSCSALDGLRSEMDDIVETVKARRDGLFNASALSESRNSNRLGQNVKLLTYVSIFYLPLAFCAALWAIPNISMSDTRTAFIVTSVVLGLVNFLVVANLNNISRNLGDTYNIWRARMVREMKDDSNDRWHQEGQRLDNSWPEQSKTPSEWLILRYQIVRIPKRVLPLLSLQRIKDGLQRRWNSIRNDNASSSDSDP